VQTQDIGVERFAFGVWRFAFRGGAGGIFGDMGLCTPSVRPFRADRFFRRGPRLKP
jgi:hypothetical protein